MNRFSFNIFLLAKKIIHTAKTPNAKISNTFIAKVYKPPSEPKNKRWVPSKPSSMISKTSIFIIINPAYIIKCIIATGIFLNIFFCPKASSTRFFQRSFLLSEISSALPKKIFLRMRIIFLVNNQTAKAVMRKKNICWSMCICN